MALPLQRSSMFLPGVRVVVWPRRTNRPLSRTWVNKDWPLPAVSLTLGGLTLTRFPPALLRFSPASFLLLACWQATGRNRGKDEVRGGKNLSQNHDFFLNCGSNLYRKKSNPGSGMGSTTPCVNPAVITVEQEVGNPYDRHKMSRTEALFQLCFSRERTPKPLK